MDIKVMRKYNRLDSITPLIIKINGVEVDKIRIGEEATLELPDDTAEMSLEPIFERVEPLPVQDGDIVMISRRTLHYVLQFIALFFALAPGILMIINIEYWPSLIFFLPAVGTTFLIDFFMKTYQMEIVGNSKHQKGSRS
ncbi:hypothetical protein [Lacicoccus alkaliphilus]|uniref:Positive regulator of sigma(E), RseC/MucC n=1 Tax=Lacicoccus alkaliphilus DSM 16010 TaxID=1123231 RepID=A0A1M7IXG0_9BACL|nr:hypothetical protein [Salinicoccus alkaliphilus]SHM45333.1 hypothetical protein SAMN02745189_02188 [Salinicoccus alkaliphilus DSM 16010]